MKDSEEQKIKIIMDIRERASGVESGFLEIGAEIDLQQLDIGDYICSDRVCIERKTVSDFLSSITDQRLFEQFNRMKKAFDIPILLIEGRTEDLFSERGIHPNAVRGAFSSIAIDYKIPTLWSHNIRETAHQIFSIAKREQIKGNRMPSARVSKKMRSTREMQEFLISGLPDINSVLSKNLLETFGTPNNVFNADIIEIMKVEGIGKEKAKKIFEVLNIDYC